MDAKIVNAWRVRHAPTLERAQWALAERTWFSAFPEAMDDASQGNDARAQGEATFRAHLGRRFPLDADWPVELQGEGIGAFGVALDVRYADLPVEVAIERAQAAARAWAAVSFEDRAAVCVEMLQRLQPRAFEVAAACMHCCGQPFAMAFQAGTPHALDRGLEALACTVREMRALPAQVLWEKPAGKGSLRVEKRFEARPRGIALVVACATFPTWNSYPGLFASLVAGNPVIVKPHPAAILPLALCVQTLQQVLREAGLPADTVQLVADTPQAPKAMELAQHPAVRLVDFTGSSAFGGWLEANARQAHVFTEKAGVNPVVVQGTRDFAGMVRNLALSLALYSGQMCTTPQRIYVPRDGIRTPEGLRTPDEFRQALVAAIGKLVADPARAVELLGAVASPVTWERIDRVAEGADVLLPSRALQHPAYPGARVRTPLVLNASLDDPVAREEQFGPISFVVEAEDAQAALQDAVRLVRERGAISWSVHAWDETFATAACDAAAAAGAHLALDLTGPLLVNQSAAFSDFHVSGRNPAGNACLTDTAFVLPRFQVLQVRRYLS